MPLNPYFAFCLPPSSEMGTQRSTTDTLVRVECVIGSTPSRRNDTETRELNDSCYYIDGSDGMHLKTSINRGRFLETSAGAIGAAAASYSFASAQTQVVATMSGAGKPSIVFCHGLWADGSCFTKVMGPLQAQGYDCIAAQYP